jgi:hypothetical protein
MAAVRTSLVALEVDRDVDLVALMAAARTSGAVDRAAPLGADGRAAQEVRWGGRMQRGVVRVWVDDDGAKLVRTEALVAPDGAVEGPAQQADLVRALGAVLVTDLGVQLVGVRDLSARTERDAAWLDRLAARGATVDDLVTVRSEGTGAATWSFTHGAARFGVPDLELYGIPDASTEVAAAALRHVVARLLIGGLEAGLALPDGTPVRLVPVLEAWPALSMGWPGLGRAGVDRGPGLDGPRATLSVLHRPWLGRHRLDLDGVRDRLQAGG